MGRHAKTQQLLEVAVEVLSEHHPMTVRQVYYQLVSRQVIENNRSQYQAVSNVLVRARQDGTIPWAWIEDRLRRPRTVSMWADLADFSETARQAYRRDVWASQPGYVEVWLEKDALSGIFEDVLESYGVTLNVGRGYDGWASIHNAADRYGGGDNASVLYFGDFDPSGEDMVRSLRERLAFFEALSRNCQVRPDRRGHRALPLAARPDQTHRYAPRRFYRRAWRPLRGTGRAPGGRVAASDPKRGRATHGLGGVGPGKAIGDEGTHPAGETAGRLDEAMTTAPASNPARHYPLAKGDPPATKLFQSSLLVATILSGKKCDRRRQCEDNNDHKPGTN